MRKAHKSSRLETNSAVHREKPATLADNFPPNRLIDLGICFALLALTIAIYSKVASYGFINYDDPEYIVNNAHVRSGLTPAGFVWAFTSAYASNWHPLTWLSHMLDVQLFGLRSGWHHVTSVAIHAISALLLFSVLKRMTGARWRSAFVAFVFALHPLHIESVAWVAERKDVLSALFWILTIWAYVRYTERKTPWRYLAVMLMFGCGLMAKPMTVTLPIVLLLLDIWPLHRIETRAGLFIEKLPMLLLAATVSVVTYIVQQRAGAVALIDQIPVWERIGNALESYVIYLAQMFWPSRLAVFYPYSEAGRWWQGIAAGLVIAGITALAVRTIRRRPYLSVGWLWYLITLLPVIGFVQVGLQSRADRYTYIPLIGMSIALAWGINDLFDQLQWSRTALAGLAVMFIAACSITTWIDLDYWQSSAALFQHAVDVTTDNYVAYNNLGSALRDEGRFTDAVSAFQNAAAIRPQAADIQDNLGESLIMTGRLDEAESHLRNALQLRPDLVKAHIDMATALMRKGSPEGAASQYRMALKLQPDSVEAHYGLGGILTQQGKVQEALPHFRQALPQLLEQVKNQPGSADLHFNLGMVYVMLERLDEAIAQFDEAVRLRPDDAEARVNLGTALSARGRMREAADQFAAAAQIRPDYMKARLALARALASMGQYDKAIAQLSEILQANPDMKDVQELREQYLRMQHSR